MKTECNGVFLPLIFVAVWGSYGVGELWCGGVAVWGSRGVGELGCGRIAVQGSRIVILARI